MRNSLSLNLSSNNIFHLNSDGEKLGISKCTTYFDWSKLGVFVIFSCWWRHFYLNWIRYSHNLQVNVHKVSLEVQNLDLILNLKKNGLLWSTLMCCCALRNRKKGIPPPPSIRHRIRTLKKNNQCTSLSSG